MEEQRKQRPRLNKPDWKSNDKRGGFSKKPKLTFTDPKKQKKHFQPKLEPSKYVEGGRRFRAIYPEYMGFDKDTRLIFMQTTKGYRADIGGGLWIGYPAKIIENNDATFMEL